MWSKEEVAAASGNNNNMVLPWEMMESILRLLPAKSLGRFRSVSKAFNALISSPRFIQSHIMSSSSRSRRKLILFTYGNPQFYSVDEKQLLEGLNRIQEDDGTDSEPTTFTPSTPATIFLQQLRYIFRDQMIPPTTSLPPATASATATQLGVARWPQRLYGSCNGLVLAKDESNHLLLVNPTTRHLWKLPPSPFPFPSFSDRPSFLMHGLCYTRDGDYMIASLCYWDRWFADPADPEPDCTDTLASVYSLRHNSWTRLPNSPIRPNVRHNSCTAVVLNGVFHWLASDTTILAFDIAAASPTQAYDEIELPHSIAKHQSMFSKLLLVGEKLALMGVGGRKELWVMEEYRVASSWRKVCSLGDNMDCMSHVMPLCLDSRWITLTHDVEFRHNDDEAALYDIIQKKCRKVRILGSPSRFDVGGAYLETLESPKPPPPSVAPSSFN